MFPNTPLFSLRLIKSVSPCPPLPCPATDAAQDLPLHQQHGFGIRAPALNPEIVLCRVWPQPSPDRSSTSGSPKPLKCILYSGFLVSWNAIHPLDLSLGTGYSVTFPRVLPNACMCARTPHTPTLPMWQHSCILPYLSAFHPTRALGTVQCHSSLQKSFFPSLDCEPLESRAWVYFFRHFTWHSAW